MLPNPPWITLFIYFFYLLCNKKGTTEKKKSGSLHASRVHIPCVCAVKVVSIARAPHVTRGRQTLRLNGFRIVMYGKTNSAINRNWKWNSKIHPINLLVFAHSACPYKNCGLKHFTEGWTLYYIIFFFFFLFYLVCNLLYLLVFNFVYSMFYQFLIST